MIDIEKKKMGRPTTDPKTNNFRIRLLDEELKKLEYCCEVYGLTKAAIARKGIEILYQKAKNSK